MKKLLFVFTILFINFVFLFIIYHVINPQYILWNDAFTVLKTHGPIWFWNCLMPRGFEGITLFWVSLFGSIIINRFAYKTLTNKNIVY
jgi:hypothetical protein